MDELEQRLEEQLIDICEILKRDFDYMPLEFMKLILEKGPVNAACALVNQDEPSEIFNKLLKNNRLDLTVEAQIVKPQYQQLFKTQVIKKAINRLNEHQYFSATLKL